MELNQQANLIRQAIQRLAGRLAEYEDQIVSARQRLVMLNAEIELKNSEVRVFESRVVFTSSDDLIVAVCQNCKVTQTVTPDEEEKLLTLLMGRFQRDFDEFDAPQSSEKDDLKS